MTIIHTTIPIIVTWIFIVFAWYSNMQVLNLYSTYFQWLVMIIVPNLSKNYIATFVALVFKMRWVELPVAAALLF